MDLCLEVYMMSVAVERRRGNLDAAENIYLKCLEKFHDKENMSAYSSIAVKYARFLTFFRNDCEKAMQIIKDAYESDRVTFNFIFISFKCFNLVLIGFILGKLMILIRKYFC